MIYGCTVYYGSKKNTVELACAMENYKTVTPKSSPDRFREVVVYKSFQQYGFDWEILLFWIHGRLGEVIANETRTHMQVRLYFMPVTVHRTKNSIKRYWRLVIENSESAQVVPDVHQVDYCRLPVLDLYIASYT